ncbi:MFS transporter [Acidothermaceae bacterium B102]|nr:MFS transporter [Acidothermaceae bacterium B102]
MGRRRERGLAHRQTAEATATYREVFAPAAVRYLMASRTLSALGDQVLRVALALLVFQSSGSPLLTAVAYALTFLPWVVGGPLLGVFADRIPRRTLIITGDLARAGLVGLMTLPHLPIGVLLALVACAELLSPAADSAAASVLPELLPGDSYVVGISVNQALSQAAQLVGFGAGGAVVAGLGARGAIGLDAASFLVAAVLVRLALTSPYPPPGAEPRTSFWQETRGGIAVALGRPGPRTLLLIAWWGAAVLLVPEALAAPLSAVTGHGGDSQTGWLLAAQPAGMIVGSFALGRLVRPAHRLALLRPLALASTLPLVGFVLRPSLPGALLLLLASGALWSYQVPLQGAFVAEIPPELRGRAFGVAAGGIQVAQGIGVLIGGGLAEILGVREAITAAGIGGAVVMLGLALLRTPPGSPSPRPQA